LTSRSSSPSHPTSPAIDREQFADDRIALYGSLMRGLGALSELGISAALHFEGSCSIPGQLFDLGSYPGLRPGPGSVRGELHRLDRRQRRSVLARLDEFEDFDPLHPDQSLYRRVRVDLLKPAGCSAWLYVYNRQPDPRLRIPDGDWRGHLEIHGRARAPSQREGHAR